MRFVVSVDDDRGAVATEYGPTLLLIAIVIVTAVAAFGIAMRGLLEQGPPAFA